MRRLLALALLAATAAAPAWSPVPWLDDLAQVRTALHETYANLDWLEGERGVAIDALVDDTASHVRQAGSDEAARAAFDRLVRRIGDGHVEIEWPRAPSVAQPPAPTTGRCAALGFDARQASAGDAPALTGYRPLSGDNAFPAGMFDVRGRRVGVIRIGVFQPQGYPSLCEAALAPEHLAAGAPCDDACADRVTDRAFIRLNADFIDRLRALKAAGATALLVDAGDNGGGSEWAEAAARMLTARRLVSERIGFVRGAHWTKHWTEVARDLRAAAATATAIDRERLLTWAEEADRARAEAATPCPRGTGCTLLGRAGFGTGLVGSAPAGAFAGEPWGVSIFSITRFAYRDGVWSGPLVVLVDDETWSAAEEFASVLQDNRAAVLIGARTGGAGCGHTDGGTPTTLGHSGATLAVPDCARFRADGSNEVRGVIPDILLPIRKSDGAAFRARLIEARLPEAIARADAFAGRPAP